MLSFIALAVITLAAVQAVRILAKWRANYKLCKASGVPFTIAPVSGNAGYAWNGIHPMFVQPLLKLFPGLNKHSWMKEINPIYSWTALREVFDEVGDVYMRCSPGQLYLTTSNAAVNVQITSRKNDFEKPIEVYTIVDMYGPSMLTTDGPEWRRQRKIVAPAFSEKSNALVWEESLRQAQGMMSTWSGEKGNSSDDMYVDDTAEGTQQLALHVISGAGFGVPQLWPGQDESKLGKRIVPGFNTKALHKKHALTFLDALHTMVSNVIWLVMVPVAVLKRSPFKLHQKVVAGFLEMGDYFRELAEYKVQQIENGEVDQGTMDLMGPLVKASENEKNPNRGSDYLTKQEITSNAWIFLFAGHETSANILHFSLLFLAINRTAQLHLQQDIDEIAGGRPIEVWTYTSDMKRFYNSMVGAVQNEVLRLVPPVINVPKLVRSKPQTLELDGKTVTIPPNTFVHLNVVGTHRNPKYYPHSPSKISGKKTDMDDFVPQRWLLSKDDPSTTTKENGDAEKEVDGLETASFESTGRIYAPPKGAFIAFSDGARACPGRRFAQVEITAVVAAIFANYSVELDVSRWASDEEVARMSIEEKRVVYKKAIDRARKLIRQCLSVITLKMYGESVPVRVVRRGTERFSCCVDM